MKRGGIYTFKKKGRRGKSKAENIGLLPKTAQSQWAFKVKETAK